MSSHTDQSASTEAWSDPTDWSALEAPAAQRTRRGVRLTVREVKEMVEIFGLGPFLTLEQAAGLVQIAPGTLRNWLSEGRLRDCALTGKPLRFVTSRFLREVAERRGRRP